MRVFIWERVSHATFNYHSEGGVVVFAETENRAREIANAVEGCSIEMNEAPDHIRDVDGGEEAVFIFPDAGCC